MTAHAEEPAHGPAEAGDKKAAVPSSQLGTLTPRLATGSKVVVMDGQVYADVDHEERSIDQLIARQRTGWMGALVAVLVTALVAVTAVWILSLFDVDVLSMIGL